MGGGGWFIKRSGGGKAYPKYRERFVGRGGAYAVKGEKRFSFS